MNKQMVLTSVWLLMFCSSGCYAQYKNGFDLEDSLIPAEKILNRGPGLSMLPESVKLSKRSRERIKRVMDKAFHQIE